MTFRIEIDETRQIALVRYIGPIDIDTIVESRAALLANPAWSQSQSQIIDFTQAEGTLTSDQIRDRALNPPPLDDDALQILVVGTTLHLGFARMFQAFANASASRRNVFVVNTLDEAYETFERVKRSR